MNAETIMTVGGVAAFGITLYWVRRRELREKYAAGWVALASLILVVGLYPDLLMVFAARAHLSYPSAVLFVALTLIYLFAFAVSVSLTTQYRRNVRLTQELALLEERLRRLEAATGRAPAEKPGA
jgi:ACR3 family arsenite efflux pump ArsB